jgi:signal transduction histidine kinase
MRKLYLLFILIPFFSFAQKLEGQKLIDSLLVELPKMKEDSLKAQLLNKLADEYLYENGMLAKQYAGQALKLSQKINYDKGAAFAFKNIANSYVVKEEYKKALINYQNGLNLSKSPTLKANMFMGISVAYYYQSDYPKAIEYNFLALKQYESINDIQNIIRLNRNIAMDYVQIKQYNNALKFYDKCILLLKKEKSIDLEYVILQEKGVCYYELKQYQTATLFLNNALKSCGNDYEVVGGCYTTLGNIDYKENKYKDALEKFSKAISVFVKIEDILNHVETLSNVAKCNLELGKIEINLANKKKYIQNSILNAKKSLTLGKNILTLSTTSEIYNTLSHAQKLQGNYKESLASHEQYVIYKDSVFNSENKETIKNLEDKREIELRDKEIRINKLSLDAKEKQKWYLLGGLGLLTIIGGLLFYQSRKRKQINEKLQILNENLDTKNIELDQANKAKTRFFSILNHDLRGPVNNLIFFLQLQKESPEMLDEESTKRMQDKTMTGAENLLASMEDILQWSKSQMENFKPQPKKVSVNQLFEDTKKVFSGYMSIQFEYQNPDNIEIFTDDNYLKTIIRNLTSNAINVFTNTEKHLIIWKAWQENTISYLSITDNGPGADAEKLKVLFEESEVSGTKSGLGLHLIRDMAKAIDCEISVDSKIGEGTTFVLKINS